MTITTNTFGGSAGSASALPAPRGVRAATTALEITRGEPDPATVTVERVYHSTPAGDSWVHGLGEPCSVPRCTALDSFSGLMRYRP